MNRLSSYIMVMWTIWIVAGCSSQVVVSERIDRLPPIVPDYIGVTVPSSIAPLNFTLNEEFERLHLTLVSRNGKTVTVSGRQELRIPPKQWSKLLTDSKNDSVILTLAVQQSGCWKQYRPFSIHVSPYPIDYGVVYRLIAPGYELYSKMGIYERTLTDFSEKPLVENTQVAQSCVNCHAFKQTDPGYMNLHIRGTHGGTLLKTAQSDSDFEIYRLACSLNDNGNPVPAGAVYPYWHPSGEYIAYSVNQTRQVFHEQKGKRVEVVDVASDLLVFDVVRNRLLTSPLLTTADFETFPAFSPDGQWLYFCCSDRRELPSDYRQVRYNLCKIAFHPETGEFGNRIDTLVHAASQGKSVSFPRPSYDGRYLMYTLSDYGNFSIWHSEADLWLYDLTHSTARPLDEVNSPDTESYHSWSSNSRWFIFSSRRDDGLYTRLYLASVDENGDVTKPFRLPQPTSHYEIENLYSYNIPEFVSKPVAIDRHIYEQKVKNPDRREITP